MIQISKFYVYEWFIVDTLEVFYVGKGTRNRRFELRNRSKYFMSVYNKYHCEVRLVHQGLTNNEACQLEIDRIRYMKDLGLARCNFTYGGEGFSSGDLNPSIRNKEKYIGENNHFYGKTHSEETKQRISESRMGKGGRFGEDNPMYGKEGMVGADNPMYGVTGFKHPNSKIYLIKYLNGDEETLLYKQCEKKFGIAFSRIYEDGGVLEYKKKTKNKTLYEGTEVIRLK